MILSKSVQSFYAAHKQELLKLFYLDQPKPEGFDKLTQIYLDRNGNIYRTWESEKDISLERYGKMLEFLQFIAKGLSAKEENDLLDRMETNLENGLKDQAKKSSAKIGAIITEMRKRQTLCIHTELLYNFMAVQWVRQDENPSIYDNEIHIEKIEVLKEETHDGIAAFFFQQPALKRLLDLSGIQKEDWQIYMLEYQAQQARLQELLNLTA